MLRVNTNMNFMLFYALIRKQTIKQNKFINNDNENLYFFLHKIVTTVYINLPLMYILFEKIEK